MENQKKNSGFWILISIVIIILIGGAFYYWITAYNDEASEQNTLRPKQDQAQEKWRDQGVAISGKYADSEVVQLDEEKFRMYYSIEPEVQGNNLEVYSATSTDGIKWTPEDGVRKEMATFPDVIKLPSGQWRMYFQNGGVIKSAISQDGLKWDDEDGTRIDKTEEGFNLSNVGAQSTTKLPDETYLMVYRGLIDEPYQTTEKVPNNNTQLFFYATSADGINFTKKGVALDSRNATLYGLTDGAELVNFDDELRLYFWSYRGVYHIVYQNEKFSKDSSFDFTNSPDSKVKFAPNPPGDPTLIKIENKWYMYYGQHEKGIYFATLND